jgi:hypothetical protein
MNKVFNKIRATINSFINNEKEYPVLAAISAGLYPLLYCYDMNFTLVNSWSQFFFYIFLYLVIPVFIFGIIVYFVKKIKLQETYRKYVVSILNVTFFAFFIVLSTSGIRNKKTVLLALVIAFVLAIIMSKHIKKIIVLQFLMAVFVGFKLLPDLYNATNYQNMWIQPSDNIGDVVLQKKPNIYYIQSDGYANFSELKRENYNFDNSEFEAYLIDNDFKFYADYRSNYYSTLTSNSSMLSMKHHYYDFPKIGKNEPYNARDIIVGNNPVISIFKKNNYKTHLLLEKSYLLINRPEIGFDDSNVDYREVSYLARGFEIQKDLVRDLELTILNNNQNNNFYFIEKLIPGHISNTYSSNPNAIEIERSKYLSRLELANNWLKEMITIIQELDTNALIIIGSDHGGYVGMNSTDECKYKLSDDTLTQSIFTAVMAIKWPENKAPQFDNKLKSNVNLFRILISYLSNDTSYLDALEADKSYSIIEDGAPSGIYEVIDENGYVVFNKIED